MLHPQLRDELLDYTQFGLSANDLPSRAQLEQYYTTFRQRFGPNQLASLEGETLLNAIHGRGEDESLAYWLEFKNDDEFPAIFGSIAGGSALKFEIFCSKQTGIWMTGAPRQMHELSLDEAVAIAREHRDQFIAGAELLSNLPPDADDNDYAQFQRRLAELAPNVYDTAWGHKYFSLLYPDKLDNYHVEDYQRYHLIRLLQVPPTENGRYVAAGRYVQIAQELEMPLNHLTRVLNHRNGAPYKYWWINLDLPTADDWKGNWNAMRQGGYAAIGWAELGDLTYIDWSRESREQLKTIVEEQYPDSGKLGNEIFSFVARMAENDLLLASAAGRLVGIGRVTSGYVYEQASSNMPHRREVDWLWQGDEVLSEKETQYIAVGRLRKPVNLVYAEQLMLENQSPVLPPATTSSPPRPIRFEGTNGRIQSILNRKKQVILYGPPGTGKTYWARQAAQNLAAAAAYGRRFDELDNTERDTLTRGSQAHGPLVRLCTFHPEYGYQDFLEGYRPTSVDGNMVFENRDGIFKTMCRDAASTPHLHYYLIIDEINRGDIPRIFGELITLLEHNKRGEEALLPLSGERFSVPPNVYIIGTMNTADRSIALLDTALRRRFGFVELMPNTSLLDDIVLEESIPLGAWLDALNQSIVAHIGRDARNLQVGHAYFMVEGRPVSEFARFARILQDDIVPLLEEYCYEDFDTLTKILGGRLVDADRQRVRHELFEPARRDALLEALLAPFPDLFTLPSVVATIPESPDAVEEEEEDLEDEGVEEQDAQSEPPVIG